MNYSMTKPCSSCPFLKEGGVPLRKSRIREIGGTMLSGQGGTFPCHKTVEYRDEETEERYHFPESMSHCAGALIFAEKCNRSGTQMMRIAERIGLYDRRKLDAASFPKVWDSLKQWLGSKTAVAK
jgi:hypothetical protein